MMDSIHFDVRSVKAVFFYFGGVVLKSGRKRTVYNGVLTKNNFFSLVSIGVVKNCSRRVSGVLFYFIIYNFQLLLFVLLFHRIV